MAKYGEGDKRWIVEERPDGTNVHNWHWAETDCLEWSKTYFTNSLSNLPIVSGEEGNLFIRTKTLEKLEGTVEIPYIADENAGEDPDVKITIKDEGEVGKRLKEVFWEKGRNVILEKVRGYVEAMAKGGPCKDEKVAPKTPAAAASGGGSQQTAVEAVPDKMVVKKSTDEKKGFKTIRVTERFRCRALDIYEILMNENRWKGFTQSNAKISRNVGGEFSIFDGSVIGTNVELQEGKLIVQKWRFASWAEGVFSMVRMTFEEPEPGVTIVNLVQSNVPEEDRSDRVLTISVICRYGNGTVVLNTERGWRDLIFHRIRDIFGFGL
ncbi:hypothetical protein Cgig2_031853 [Carnegiea gigantea]|uniref:Activator of Hsp90 ATPase AHSA1-like N-terminal domain-containing protein n=1 Tax=Carnegiea gigantea TaxID=171969 RepID=A0A9Q1KR42_9CARY|nr:hypothetical protein Cgig2_031853 [Carnegiea gigantea]